MVVPLFTLSAYSYKWPPPRASRDQLRQSFAGVLADKRLSASHHGWFVVLRLRRSGRVAG